MAEASPSVLTYLNEDLLDVDLAFSVFAAAVTNYKWESLVKPFPPMYILSNGEKDISSLTKAVGVMPCLRKVAEGKVKLTDDQVKLLDWLMSVKKTRICSVGLEKLKELQRLTGEALSLPTPQYIYELCYNEQHESTFASLCADTSVLRAYHGSRVENFFSILHHGLHAHMNKTSLYGEGTYLSVEPTVAMEYSPWARSGWSNSSLGSSLSIIALCEVVDHPSVVHTGSAERTSAKLSNRMYGDMPDQYLIVTNNDMVRVKYLLVYAKKETPARSQRSRQSPIMHWIHNNFQATLIILYLVILLFIGLVRTSSVWMKVQQFYEDVISGWKWTSDRM